MRLIDADKFLKYLIFSKHIDGLTCGEVKKAIEMCKVDIFDKINRMRGIVDYLLMNIRHANSVPTTFLKVSMRFLISTRQKVRSKYGGYRVSN